jgi:hypothetical protein
VWTNEDTSTLTIRALINQEVATCQRIKDLRIFPDGVSCNALLSEVRDF